MAKDNVASWDAFCMYRLAYAIVNNDFSYQDAADFSVLPSYFPESLALLKSIDFNEIDAITIAYGTNDLTGGVTIDDQNDPHNTATFAGALRYSLELLMAAFPQLHVYVCGLTYRFWESGGVFQEDSDTYENHGQTMQDFIDKGKNVSYDYHITFIDNNRDLGINKYNRAHWFPAGDGTHHNVAGARLIAEHMARIMF